MMFTSMLFVMIFLVMLALFILMLVVVIFFAMLAFFAFMLVIMIFITIQSFSFLVINTVLQLAATMMSMMRSILRGLRWRTWHVFHIVCPFRLLMLIIKVLWLIVMLTIVVHGVMRFFTTIFEDSDLSKRVCISSGSNLLVIRRRPNGNLISCAKEHHS